MSKTNVTIVLGDGTLRIPMRGYEGQLMLDFQSGFEVTNPHEGL